MPDSQCTICGRWPTVARGWCKKHYRRWQEHGDPTRVWGGHNLDDPLSRFWAKVDKTGECWVWTANRVWRGYGQFTVNGGKVRAHRFSYELAYGSIPDGLVVCHRCDNPPCVRPDHLFVGTPAENMADMERKGRAHRPGRPRKNRELANG